MLETGVPAWPLPPPFPLNPCLLPRSLANGRGEMCKRACETIAQASSPERCQRTSPRNSHKQPRENIDLLITSPLQRIAARRARERHAQRHLANQSFRAKRERKIFTFCKANSNTSARSAERNFLHAIAERTNDANKEKTNEKMRAFPPPHGQPRRGSSRKNACVSPAPPPPAKRK